jgi:hypothetical protein
MPPPPPPRCSFCSSQVDPFVEPYGSSIIEGSSRDLGYRDRNKFNYIDLDSSQAVRSLVIYIWIYNVLFPPRPLPRHCIPEAAEPRILVAEFRMSATDIDG